MSLEVTSLYIIVTFYFIGSVPFALLVYKLLRTKDPRTAGSLNPGATNMYRIAGAKAGVITFVGDFSKGFLPIVFISEYNQALLYFYSIFILLGHMFSIFNRFSGGKGVATSFGFLVAIDYVIGLAIIFTWILVFILKRISGLSAIVSFILLPIIIYILNNEYNLLILSILHTLVILYNHKKNIRALLNS